MIFLFETCCKIQPFANEDIELIFTWNKDGFYTQNFIGFVFLFFSGQHNKLQFSQLTGHGVSNHMPLLDPSELSQQFFPRPNFFATIWVDLKGHVVSSDVFENHREV